MYEQLINKRIFHVSLLIAFSIFLFQILDWPQGIWIPISILAIVGPFRPGMTIDKSKQRILGTIAGLILSIIASELIRHIPLIIIPLIIVLIFCFAYFVLDPDLYKYMIMLITIFICINYAYINPPFYSELDLFVNRLMAVFTGVTVYLFAELVIFKRYYHNATDIIEHENINQTILESIDHILEHYAQQNLDITTINDQVAILINKQDALYEHRKSALRGFSNQDQTLNLIEFYQKKIEQTLEQFNTLGSKTILNTSLTNEDLTPVIQCKYFKQRP